MLLKQSFKKRHALAYRKVFALVKSKGTKYIGKWVVVLILEVSEEKTCLGIIASKQYDKQATRRNRARRLIREAFRLIQRHIHKDIWILIIARKPMYKAKCQDIYQDLRKALR